MLLHLYVSNVVNHDAYTHLRFDVFRGLRKELDYSLKYTFDILGLKLFHFRSSKTLQVSLLCYQNYFEVNKKRNSHDPLL